MKHKNLAFIFATILTIGSAVSCGSGKKKDSIEESFINPNPIDVVQANAKDANVNNNEKYDNIELKHQIIDGETYEIIDNSASLYGLLLVKNSTEHVGLYSVTNDSFLVNCSYRAEWLEYEIIPLGHLALVDFYYENQHMVVDNFGNKVFENDTDSIPTFQSHLINGDVYLTFDNYIYEYINGSLYSVYELPEQNEVSPELPDVEEDFDVLVDQLFVGNVTLKLDDVGLAGSYLCATEDGITTFFVSKGQAASTFILDPDSKYIVTSEYIYYQEHIYVPDDSTNYTYISSRNKYLLKTKRVELLTGKEDTVNFNYSIEDVTYLKDKSGLKRNLLIKASKINRNKILELPRDILFDVNLNKVGDYTGYYLDSFLKVGENYYNEVSKILFDKNFNEITDLENMNPQLIASCNVFVGEFENKKGLVDNYGKVLIPFEYDEVIYNTAFSYAILISDENVITYNLDSKNILGRYIEAEVLPIDRHNELYLIKNANESRIFRLNGDGASSYESGELIAFAMNKSLNDEKDLIIQFEHVYFVYSYETQDLSFKTINEEKDYYERIGESIDDCFSINIGEQKYFHGLGLNKGIYINFMPDEDAYFNAITPSYNYKIVDSEGKDVTKDTTGYPCIAGLNYYIVAYFSGYQEVTLQKISRLASFNDYFHSYLDYGTETVSLKVSTPNYYEFEHLLPTKMYKVNNGKIVNISLNYLPYSNGNLMKLERGTYYLVYRSSYNYGNEIYANPFTIDSVLSCSNSSGFVTQANKHLLLKYIPSETSNYSVVINNSYSYILYKYDSYNDEITEVTPYEHLGEKQYPLTANEKYVLDILPTSSGHNIDVKFVKPYDSIDIYSLDTSKSFTHSGDYLIDIQSNTYAYVSSTSYCTYKIYKINNINGFIAREELPTNYFNGKPCYQFFNNETYIADLECTSSYYTSTFQLTTLNEGKLNAQNAVTSLNKTNPQLGRHIYLLAPTLANTYYKVSASANNPWKFYRVIDDYDYRYEKLLVKKSSYGDFVYITPGYFYLFVIDVTESTTFGFSNYGSDINKAPYTINENTFLYDAWTEKYVSTNEGSAYSTSSMYVTANITGQLSFNYDISSESGYDKIVVLRNGYNISISPNSGYYDEQLFTLNVSSGDRIEIRYSKDSSRDYGEDCVYVYNINIL